MDEPLLHLETFCTKDCFIISRQILISLCVPEPLQELPCLYWLLANGLLPRGVQGQGGGQRRHNTTKLDHQMLWVITCCGCWVWIDAGIYSSRDIFPCLRFCSQIVSYSQPVRFRGEIKLQHLQTDAYVWLSVMTEKPFWATPFDRNTLLFVSCKGL